MWGSPEFFKSPYPFYARLREGPAVQFDRDANAWLIPHYHNVASALKDSRFTKQAPNPGGGASPFQSAVLFRDPPEHTRVRSLLNQAFTNSRIERLKDQMTAIAGTLLERCAREGGTFDFIRGFALPFPVNVIASMLGVPACDYERLHQWSSAFIADSREDPEVSQARNRQAAGELTEYFTQLTDERRRKPGDDILSSLISACDDGGRLSSDEVIGNSMLLLIAGHETTVNLFGNGLHLLLMHPDQMARLRGDPEALLPSAIEEMLRFEPPVQHGTFRIAAADFEFCGSLIPGGALVHPLIASANRDPAIFPEPERFDISRSPNRHLSFGFGPHFCLGAVLARMEASIGFRALIERFKSIDFAKAPAPDSWFGKLRSVVFPRDPGQTAGMAWRHSAISRGLSELSIRAR